MSDLGLQLPLRIRHLNHECIVVEDAIGARCHYVYLDTDDTRRRSRNSVRPEQGMGIAQVVARALTVELERRRGSRGVRRSPARRGCGYGGVMVAHKKARRSEPDRPSWSLQGDALGRPAGDPLTYQSAR